jgi:predicted 3-demethylubiquinone-9 3-methyltransferase (glyoxalase superfamily)
MPVTQRIAPCLWFDHEAEEAATFYVSVFKELEDHRHRSIRQGWP